MKKTPYYLLLSLLVIALIGAISYQAFATSVSEASPEIVLLKPEFIAGDTADIDAVATTIQNEAGIAAYFDAQQPIDLLTARSIYRTIETETADYILGSVQVSTYGEDHDMHVYIHKDGYVLAYYDDSEPTSRIFDWYAYTGGNAIPTKLDTLLSSVASTVGTATSEFSYYHFSYPNATHLLMVVETVSDGGWGSFNINLPASYGYFERSWSLAENDDYYFYAGFYLNGTEIQGISSTGFNIVNGTLTASQLGPNTDHLVQVNASDSFYWNESAHIGLALVYEVNE